MEASRIHKSFKFELFLIRKFSSNEAIMDESVKSSNGMLAIKTVGGTSPESSEMDAIRARGFMKYNYNYDPPHDVSEMIERVAKQHSFQIDGKEWQNLRFSDSDIKGKVLKNLGECTKHYIPNSQLHKINSLADVLAFYSTRVKNITRYSEMARNEFLPKNIAVREHPIRFHPNDKDAIHNGITAFPGEGGEIYGIRNKRLYRQFKPKREWFEYEDQSFDYDDVSKGLPWDMETAKKMDQCTYKRFSKDRVVRI